MTINAGGARSCTARQPPSVARHRRGQRAAHSSRSSVKAHATSFNPVSDSAAAFAPATIANLGPGFDWMGCAVEYEGDTVIARVLPDAEPGTVVIESIHGDGGKLPLKADANCVGIAAKATMKMFPGECSVGVGLTLKKGLPLGSGLGSSAASAAAGAWAVNSLFGCPITKEQLVLAGLEAEATVSGYHADNIAPALLGGFILIRSADPLDIQQLAFPTNAPLYFVLVNPKFEAPTKEMRAALPSTVPFSSMITNSVMGGSLVAAIMAGDVELLGRSLDRECVVEPARGKLIPGFQAVKAAAKAEGAYGCTISGAGPTAVAVVADRERGEAVAAAMMDAFRTEGKLEINAHAISTLDMQGAVSLPCL